MIVDNWLLRRVAHEPDGCSSTDATPILFEKPEGIFADTLCVRGVSDDPDVECPFPRNAPQHFGGYFLCELKSTSIFQRFPLS
jgi:hypothetical protein